MSVDVVASVPQLLKSNTSSHAVHYQKLRLRGLDQDSIPSQAAQEVALLDDVEAQSQGSQGAAAAPLLVRDTP